MHHLAIMNKSWGMLVKILSGGKHRADQEVERCKYTLLHKSTIKIAPAH